MGLTLQIVYLYCIQIWFRIRIEINDPKLITKIICLKIIIFFFIHYELRNDYLIEEAVINELSYSYK